MLLVRRGVLLVRREGEVKCFDLKVSSTWVHVALTIAPSLPPCPALT